MAVDFLIDRKSYKNKSAIFFKEIINYVLIISIEILNLILNKI